MTVVYQIFTKYILNFWKCTRSALFLLPQIPWLIIDVIDETLLMRKSFRNSNRMLGKVIGNTCSITG